MSYTLLENFMLLTLILLGLIIVYLLLGQERLAEAYDELRAAYHLTTSKLFDRICREEPRKLLECDLPDQEVKR